VPNPSITIRNFCIAVRHGTHTSAQVEGGVDLTKGDVTTTALMSKQAAAATARRMRAPDEARLKRIQTKYELPSCGGKQTKHELPSCGGKQTKYGLPSRETGGRRETAARAHPNETPPE
jgi:hypothetical protein